MGSIATRPIDLQSEGFSRWAMGLSDRLGVFSPRLHNASLV